jgi:hypothetical protein
MTSRLQAGVEHCIAAGGIVSAADAKRIKYFFIGLRRNISPPKNSFWRGAKSLPPKALGADVAGRSFKPRGTIRDIFGGNEKGSGACSCYEGNVHE